MSSAVFNTKKNSKRICIFSNSSNQNQEQTFREVCNELSIESVFVKGKIKDEADILNGMEGIIAAVVFQRKDPGENLDLISDIKINLRKTPIIFYSTRYSEDIETLIRRTGVHYFLTPQFTRDELALVLEALMERMKNDSYQRV